MIFGKEVLAKLWSEAINTAAYITNRVTTRANIDMTPEQKISRKKPNLSNI